MLTLLCPGLLGPIPAIPDSLPPVPTLDRLLARADRIATGHDDAGRALLESFGIAADPEGDPPTAPLSLLGEACDEPRDGYWMHADPVHLRPDRDRLLLYSGAAIAPTRKEADDLIALFNAHFGSDGLRLTAPWPDRWYLRSDQELDLKSEPLHRVTGGPISADSPRGEDARRWSGLMSEIQMLFFASEVNRSREQEGRPAISGIWTWGGGRLSEPSGDAPDVVIGDDPLTLGLARWAGVAHRTLGRWSEQGPSAKGRCVVLWDRLRAALSGHDLTAWSSALVDLNARLAESELALGRQEVAVILIDPCRGNAYRVSRPALRRFWRRRRFADALSQSIADRSR
ncbi:MAG: phosphoglycerate mutase [Thiocapsa sp.]|jgi:hypothetical protein|nr:phosphoglycerate mutase [Thiocapsa sp.]MCG6984334.1 phosphoglycerate mutase [Thiocapsa sp.]